MKFSAINLLLSVTCLGHVSNIGKISYGHKRAHADYYGNYMETSFCIALRMNCETRDVAKFRQFYLVWLLTVF